MDAEAPEPVEVESIWRFSIPSSEPLGRPIIAINDVTFDYNLERSDGTKKMENEYLLQKVNFGVDNSSKIAILGANGQVCRIGSKVTNLVCLSISPRPHSVSLFCREKPLF